MSSSHRRTFKPPFMGRERCSEIKIQHGSHFLTLPSEIRTEIFSYLLPAFDGCLAFTKPSSDHPLALPTSWQTRLLLVCRQINLELRCILSADHVYTVPHIGYAQPTSSVPIAAVTCLRATSAELRLARHRGIRLRSRIGIVRQPFGASVRNLFLSEAMWEDIFVRATFKTIAARLPNVERTGFYDFFEDFVDGSTRGYRTRRIMIVLRWLPRLREVLVIWPRVGEISIYEKNKWLNDLNKAALDRVKHASQYNEIDIRHFQAAGRETMRMCVGIGVPEGQKVAREAFGLVRHVHVCLVPKQSAERWMSYNWSNACPNMSGRTEFIHDFASLPNATSWEAFKHKAGDFGIGCLQKSYHGIDDIVRNFKDSPQIF